MQQKKPMLVPPIIASLTLGLAPFTPEPHIVGKLRWIAGGADGMIATDWLDTIMHGAPWLWLGFALVAFIRAGKIPKAD
jgi:apolipoprotein N-acyltransferase